MSVLLVAPMQIGAKTGYTTPTYLSSTKYFGTGTSHVANKPASVVAGTFMIAIVELSTNTPTITPPSGWATDATRNTDVGVGVYHKIAGGSEPSTYTFGLSGSANARIFILAYPGASTVLATNLGSVVYGSNDPWPAPSMSVVKDRILLAVAHIVNASVTLTSGPAGMTQRETAFTDNSPRGAVYDEVSSATGASGTRDFNLDSSRFGVCFLIQIQ